MGYIVIYGEYAKAEGVQILKNKDGTNKVFESKGEAEAEVISYPKFVLNW